MKNWTTNTSGERISAFLHGAKSGYLIAPTTKKYWKFSMADVNERGFWKDYQEAYEEMIQNTAAKHAPWFVVPADNKWFTRLIVASAIIQALDELHLSFPDVDKEKKKELERVRESLLQEKS